MANTAAFPAQKQRSGSLPIIGNPQMPQDHHYKRGESTPAAHSRTAAIEHLGHPFRFDGNKHQRRFSLGSVYVDPSITPMAQSFRQTPRRPSSREPLQPIKRHQPNQIAQPAETRNRKRLSSTDKTVSAIINNNKGAVQRLGKYLFGKQTQSLHGLAQSLSPDEIDKAFSRLKKLVLRFNQQTAAIESREERIAAQLALYDRLVDIFYETGGIDLINPPKRHGADRPINLLTSYFFREYKMLDEMERLSQDTETFWKCVPTSSNDWKEHLHFYQEWQLGRTLDPRHFVACQQGARPIAVKDANGNICQMALAFPRANAGSIAERIARGDLTFAQKKQIAQSLTEALAYLHSQDIRHGDLSINNGVLEQDKEGNLTARLIDLGQAHKVEDSKRYAFHKLDCRGTYITPEHQKGLPSNDETDIFTFGLILYQLFQSDYKLPPLYRANMDTTDELPELDSWLNDLFHQTLRGLYSQAPSFAITLASTLKAEPSERSSAEALLEHDFIKDTPANG